MAWSALSRVARFGKAFAGWFGLYVAAGTLLFYVVPIGHFTSDPTCRPFYSAFGQIESNCTLGIGNVFWALVLGIPRLIVTPGGLAFALIKAVAKNGFTTRSYALDALPFLVVFIPVALLIWQSFSYWRQRHILVARLIVSIFLVETVILGFLA